MTGFEELNENIMMKLDGTGMDTRNSILEMREAYEQNENMLTGQMLYENVVRSEEEKVNENK